MIIVNIVYLVSITGLGLLWVRYGLSWVAGAWLVGNILAAALSFALIYLRNQPEAIPAVTS
jgi:hypothetical protein